MHAVEQLVPDFLERLDALGIPLASRPRLLRAIDELIGYLGVGQAPGCVATRDDLQRFWCARAGRLDPHAVSATRRALHIVGELLDARQLTSAAAAAVAPHDIWRADPGDELVTGETLALPYEDTTPPYRDDALASPRAANDDVEQAHDMSTSRAAQALDADAPPQLEVCWNRAGWFEVSWRGFAAGTGLRRTLRRAWHQTHTRHRRALLLNLHGASGLTDSDARWLQRWLEAVQRDPLARIALVGVDTMLERLAPTPLPGTQRSLCFPERDGARTWLESSRPSGDVSAVPGPEASVPVVGPPPAAALRAPRRRSPQRASSARRDPLTLRRQRHDGDAEA